MREPLAVLFLGILLVACGVDEAPVLVPVTSSLPSGDDSPRIGRFPRSQFYLERDRFYPVNDPETVPAAEATYLRHDDEVFGVVVNGQARAYPVPMISYHHVVNDVIGGIPIAVTY